MRGWQTWVWGLLTGTTLLLAMVLCLGPLTDLRWELAHTTRSVGPVTLQVPFGWRIAESEVGQGGNNEELLLRRGRWNWIRGRSVDEINLRPSREGFDTVELAQRWDRIETHSMIPGDRLEPTPASSYLREHYRCSDAKRTEDGTISFGCFKREGRWAVWYRGRRSGVRDLAALLESASDAGSAAR